MNMDRKRHQRLLNYASKLTGRQTVVFIKTAKLRLATDALYDIN